MSEKQPGAKSFLNYLALSFIAIFMLGFLYVSDFLGDKAEQVHIDKTLSEMNATLALVMYKFAVNNQLGQLQKFHHGNPFVFLAEYERLPANYAGSVASINDNDTAAMWFYEVDTGRVVYRMRDGKQVKVFRLSLDFEDQNQNGFFDDDSERILGFSVKPE